MLSWKLLSFYKSWTLYVSVISILYNNTNMKMTCYQWLLTFSLMCIDVLKKAGEFIVNSGRKCNTLIRKHYRWNSLGKGLGNSHIMRFMPYYPFSFSNIWPRCFRARTICQKLYKRYFHVKSLVIDHQLQFSDTNSFPQCLRMKLLSHQGHFPRMKVNLYLFYVSSRMGKWKENIGDDIYLPLTSWTLPGNLEILENFTLAFNNTISKIIKFPWQLSGPKHYFLMWEYWKSIRHIKWLQNSQCQNRKLENKNGTNRNIL